MANKRRILTTGLAVGLLLALAGTASAEGDTAAVVAIVAVEDTSGAVEEHDVAEEDAFAHDVPDVDEADGFFAHDVPSVYHAAQAFEYDFVDVDVADAIGVFDHDVADVHDAEDAFAHDVPSVYDVAPDMTDDAHEKSPKDENGDHGMDAKDMMDDEHMMDDEDMREGIMAES